MGGVRLFEVVYRTAGPTLIYVCIVRSYSRLRSASALGSLGARTYDQGLKSSSGCCACATRFSVFATLVGAGHPAFLPAAPIRITPGHPGIVENVSASQVVSKSRPTATQELRKSWQRAAKRVQEGKCGLPATTSS